ncbi:hypothetical protein GGR52DRAFT_586651 [Hypoxylon sp. FL1284]|nr:hypothetical protein GGR52DRAFT_586651 [Hypoxylon sp. FL1284]
MVGVAGKSQACHTCRQKRLRCDMRRPYCRKCVKAKRTCAGYDRDLIFVNRTPSDSSVTATSVQAERRAQQQLHGAIANPATEARLHELFAKSQDNCCDFRKYAFELLEAMYLPKRPFTESEGSYSWAYCLTGFSKPSKSLDASLYAFSLSQFHTTGAGRTSLYQCLNQYNIALRHLYADLNDPETRSQEETLTAIIVLSTCELFVCPAPNGWSVHARGIAEILRLRDPKMANTPTWRHLFSRMRVVCTLEALTKRQAQLLQNDIWQQIVTESSFKGPLDEIMNMAAGIPAILEKATTLSSIGDQAILLAESAKVTQSMLARAKTLKTWLDGFWRSWPRPRAWLIPSLASNPADIDSTNKVFPLCYEFESHLSGVPLFMSWGLITQLYSHVIQIHDLVQERLGRSITLQYLLAQADAARADSVETSSQNAQSLITDEHRSIRDIHDEGAGIARQLCQALEYFHRIDMGTYGGQSITFPAWIARQFFRLHPGHEREASWLENMHNMKGQSTRWGLSMMTFADVAEPLKGRGSGTSRQD